MIFLKSNCRTKLHVSFYLAAERCRRVGLLNGLSFTSRPKHDNQWRVAVRVKKTSVELPRALGSPMQVQKSLFLRVPCYLGYVFVALDIKRME
jgi:hypothetical protein